MNPWQGIGQLSKQEIQTLQNKKLADFIRHYIYPFSPRYRKIFDSLNLKPEDIKTVQDLQRLPFTSKRDFANDNPENPGGYKEYIVQPSEQTIKKYWPKSKMLSLAYKKLVSGKDAVDDIMNAEFRPVFITFTTGTTSKPVPFVYTNHDMENLKISGARMLYLFGVDPSQRIVNIFPFAPHLAFWQVVMGGLSANALILSTGGGKTIGTQANINAILNMKPTVILGVPSYIYHLLRVAHQEKCDFSSIKRVILGASRVTVTLKKKIIELLEEMGGKDISVFGTYGFTEARCAWGECPTPLDEPSGYFTYPDKEIFEVIDPETGEVKGEGEDGELVYTSLDARGSAMIRFRTGDFVRGGITYEKCPHSQLTVPRISSDITRLSDVKDMQITKIKGALVNFNTFTVILSNFTEIDEWQIEICKKNNDPFEVDELKIHLCVSQSCNQQLLEEKLRKEFLNLTELSPNEVCFCSLEEMVSRLELETANKAKRIIDNRPVD